MMEISQNLNYKCSLFSNYFAFTNLKSSQTKNMDPIQKSKTANDLKMSLLDICGSLFCCWVGHNFKTNVIILCFGILIIFRQ
jgi:hypothetical protein